MSPSACNLCSLSLLVFSSWHFLHDMVLNVSDRGIFIFFNIIGGVAGDGGGRRKSLFLFIGLISYCPSPLVLLFLGHMALATSFSSAIDHCHLICSSFLYRYLLTSYRSIVGAVENNLRSLISSINLSSHRSLISSID